MSNSRPTLLHELAYMIGVVQALNEDLAQSQGAGYRAGRQRLRDIREESSWSRRFSREVENLPDRSRREIATRDLVAKALAAEAERVSSGGSLHGLAEGLRDQAVAALGFFGGEEAHALLRMLSTEIRRVADRDAVVVVEGHTLTED